MNTADFSVLLSIYRKEKPEWFNRALHSIWDEQSLKPKEIVLVEDGPLTEELYRVIEDWKLRLGTTLKPVPLEQNRGLGIALNEGLKHCSHPLVARMDTDDIAMPERFKKQIAVFNNIDIDICGSWIDEFSGDENIVLSTRKLPEKHDDIYSFSKKRNPLNHPSVMYKKASVIEAGSYEDMLWFEDYYLWVKLLMQNKRFYNIQESLVRMRSGPEQLARRRSLAYAKKELVLLKSIRQLGHISLLRYVSSVIVRTTVRLLPEKGTKAFYKLLRKLK